MKPTKFSRFCLQLLIATLPCVTSQETLPVVRDEIDGFSNATSTIGRRLMETSAIRFNKFYGEPRGFKPLVNHNYPVRGGVYDMLTSSTDATDVIMLNDARVRKYNIPKIVERIGGWPNHPEADESAPYWNELRHFIDIQKKRMYHPDLELFPRAEVWRGWDLNEVAEAVHNEVPGSLQSLLMEEMFEKRWGEVYLDPDVFPQSCDPRRMHFSEEDIVEDLNQWVIDTVMPPTFALKWYVGRARPEEVLWAIKKGRITDGVPSDIRSYVNNLDSNSQFDFTAYEEGSPTHPSWPAMHAASGSCSFWMSIIMDLNPEQLCQARLTDYAIAFARTVAGVHYQGDNIMGLNYAQEILEKELPSYLAYRYGANPQDVKRKIREIKYDWNEFDHEDPCPFLNRNYDLCYLP
mmetsp:Transcript_18589/g.22777  ORF Transcript_18589/g.22777 Transcript_18589/m.22777 type:complete len:406 (-) Transcript_18589:303-1520(-)